MTFITFFVSSLFVIFKITMLMSRNETVQTVNALKRFGEDKCLRFLGDIHAVWMIILLLLL